MSAPQGNRSGTQRGGGAQPPKAPHGAAGQLAATEFPDIRFGQPLNAELFNNIALNAARAVAFREDGRPRNENKTSQLRRFYDELCLWEMRTAQQPEKFSDFLPFIRMINAKAAYAEGRKLVDQTFMRLMHHTLSQVNDVETMTHCKLFWEAFLGFYKQVRQD